MHSKIGRSEVRASIVAGLLLLLMVGTVAGQRIDSPYRFVNTTQAVGGFGGYISAGQGAIGLGPESGAVFGGRYGLRISGPFVLEAEVGYFPSTRAVFDTVPADTTLRAIGKADLTLVLARAALRFNLTGPRTYRSLQPFVVFGAGLAIDVAGDAADEEDLPEDVRFDFGTSFAGDIGAGIDWYLSRSVSMRLDGRNLLWRLRTPQAFLLGERGLQLPDREWSQNFFLSAGLSIHF
jgi:hypothetical protein